MPEQEAGTSRDRQRRYLVAHIPSFRLDRCGYSSNERAVLVGDSKNALRVLCMSAAARKVGVRLGMSASQARALSPDLLVERWDPEQETQDLQALALQLLRVSPWVSALPPDSLAAELQAWPAGAETEPLLARERLVLGSLRARLRELGHEPRIVVAEDLRGSRILAVHGGSDRVLSPGLLAPTLAALPLFALDPEPSLALLLEELGIRSIGALAALPPASVRSRLGPEALRLHGIACGALFRAGFPVRAEESSFSAQELLPWPLESVEPLLFVAHRLLLELLCDLQEKGQALLRLEMILDLEDSSSLSLSFRTGRPLRDATVLGRLLRRRLEGARVESPIVALRLCALEHLPFHGAQEGLLGRIEPRGSLPELLAALRDGLEPQALFVPELRDRWRPERAWEPAAVVDQELDSPLVSASALASARTERVDFESDPAEPHENWVLDLPLSRPAILLAEPRAVELEPPEQPRRINIEGRWVGVLRADLRERLAGEWWETGFDRLYQRLLLEDGRRAWVYQEMGRFFLHGWFD